MPLVFGYLCPHGASVEQSGDATTQRETIEAFAKDHNLNVPTIFTDPADSSHLTWFERPLGQQLVSQLEPGSHVIVPDPFSICTKLTELLEIIESFYERAIELTIINCKVKENVFCSISTTGGMGEWCVYLLRYMLDWGRNNRSEAVSEGMQDRKSRGKKHCHYPGYGSHWKYGRRKVHPQEQGTIKQIVELREKRFSWYKIAAHLLRHQVLTSDGREWSPSRVRRAYISETQHRADVN